MSSKRAPARAGFPFPRSSRLRERAEFDRLQTGSAQRGSSQHFLLLTAPRSGSARLGIIASRRVGSAVHRNRAKRMIRDWFRHRAAGMGSIDVVVVVKTGAHELVQAKADAELSAALARAGKSAPSIQSRPGKKPGKKPEKKS